MLDDANNYYQDFYSQHLKLINDINFTAREIDLIACLLSGRTTKGAASLLSISPKTAETHIYNAMSKAGVSSRDGLISFIEKSQKMALVQQYYNLLVVHAAFMECLAKVAKLKKSKASQSYSLLCPHKPLANLLKSNLKTHLQKTGLKIEVKYLKDSERPNLEKFSEEDTLTFFISDKADAGLKAIIDLSEVKNYYAAVFKILESFFPKKDIDGIYIAFQQNTMRKNSTTYVSQPDASSDNIPTSAPQYKTLPLKWQASIALCTVIMLGLGIYIFSMQRSTSSRGVETSQIRSEFIIPKDTVLLNRPEFITIIDQALKGKEIQTVALIGTGGAGKTTLARQYARLQKAKVVWEINAETKDCIIHSFEELAYNLAQTEAEKEEIRQIRLIGDKDEKSSQILLFVKTQLKKQDHWLLIFDNVESFDDIKAFLPHSSKVWGNGKVILTTRDQNFKSNTYINSKDIIFVGSLDKGQKLSLFKKILCSKGKCPELTGIDAQRLLDKIPAYPLDVTVTAYYLSETQNSFSQYMSMLENSESDLRKNQEMFMKNIQEYSRTRFGIISLSIEKILKEDKDFKILFLTIGLLSSQNIPFHFLSTLKDKLFAERFLHKLKSHSLIVSEEQNKLGLTFSVHRSTQEVIMQYLIENLSANKRAEAAEPIVDTFTKIFANLNAKYDYQQMQLMLKHLESLLSNKDKLNQSSLIWVYFYLGKTYFALGDLKNAEEKLVIAHNMLGKIGDTNHSLYLESFLTLGHFYRANGSFHKARQLLEKSLTKHGEILLEEPRMASDALVALGNNYRYLGLYSKAEECLKKSIAMFEKKDGSNNQIATGHTYLGALYEMLGDSSRALKYVALGHNAFKKIFGKDHFKTLWSSIYLADILISQGDYIQAKTILLHAQKNFRALLLESSPLHTWIHLHLGKVHFGLKDYQKAKTEFELALARMNKIKWDSYDKHVTLSCLAKTHLALGNLNLAEKFYQEALSAFKTYNKPNYGLVLAGLADVSMAHYHQSVKRKERRSVQKSHLAKANDLINQAYSICCEGFGKDSPHTRNVLAKKSEIDGIEPKGSVQ